MGKEGAAPSAGAPRTWMVAIVALACWTHLPAPAVAQTLVVTSRTTGRVAWIDLDSGRTLRWFDVGPDPHELAAAPGSAVVWVASYGGGGVTEIDLLAGESRTLAPGSGLTHDVVVGPDARRIWLTSEADSAVVEIDAVSGGVTRRLPHGMAMGHMIAGTPERDVLWVPDLRGDGLARIDVSTGETRRIPLDGPAEGIAVAPDDGEIWVTLVQSDEVVVLDSAGTPLDRFPSGGERPVKLRMQPGGARVWVSNNGSGVISVFDRASRARVADIPVGPRPLGIAFDEAGGRAYVTRPGAEEVVEIDTQSLEVTRRIPGPPSADGLAWIPPHPVPERVVRFEASDGTGLFGDLHHASTATPRALLLLLHQGGGSGRAEYRNIVPRLLERGFDVLAVDLPGGGERFGGFNRALRALSRPWLGYCDDYPAAAAALDQAMSLARDTPIVVIGSSYTATLALQLAGRRSADLAGVAAFSPASGEPLAACPGVSFTEDVGLPVLAVRPRNEAELPSVRADLETLERQGHETWIAEPGTHGASMLDPLRVENAEATWRVLNAWIERALEGASSGRTGAWGRWEGP